jgi:hypothetical protein
MAPERTNSSTGVSTDARPRCRRHARHSSLTVTADQPRDTARAVATLLGLAAIGVEDPVVNVVAGLTWCLKPQQLVEADAAPPIGERANPVGRWQGQAIAADQDKVVAEPVHFRERNAHGVIDPGSE